MLALGGFGLALAALAAAPNEIALGLLILLAGIPLSPFLGILSASVQRSVPSTMIAEAFTWTFAVITAGIAAGNAIGGAITQASGVPTASLAAAGFALGGAALGGRPLLPDREPTSRPAREDAGRSNRARHGGGGSRASASGRRARRYRTG